MYNLRYHLASLASVFLALAVGLVLGGLIADQAPSAAQDVLVKGIEKDIAQTRETNNQLRGENKNLGDFSDFLLQNFVEGRLEGMIVQVLGYNDKDANAAVLALENAGAVATVLQPTYDAETAAWSVDEATLIDPNGQPLVSAIVNIFEPGEEDEGSLEDYLNYLADLSERVQLPLICASTDGEETRLVEFAWKSGFSGTNQLRNRFGAYTLVALLSNSRPGLYGTSPTATALFPPLPPNPIEEPAP